MVNRHSAGFYKVNGVIYELLVEFDSAGYYAIIDHHNLMYYMTSYGGWSSNKDDRYYLNSPLDVSKEIDKYCIYISPPHDFDLGVL